MLLASLNEMKTFLDIDPEDSSEDKLLNYYSEIATEWIEELLDRKISKKFRVEYYNGTGSKKLLLRHRPVYTTPTIAVNVDESGSFGQPTDAFDSGGELVYGTDFSLKIDQEDGTSRSAILYRLTGFWPKRSVRERGTLSPFLGESSGTIKVTYTAGYTTDTLPADLRMAFLLLVGRLRGTFPLSVELQSDNFEERSLSPVTNVKTKLLDLIRPVILSRRNWTW